MGYYSDVMLITEVENREIVEDIFSRFSKESSLEPPNLLSWAENKDGFEYTDSYGPFYNRTERNLIMWEWKGMRWTGYDSWHHYVALEEALTVALTYADTEGSNSLLGSYAHFGMIVVGEDLEDIRLIGSPYDYNMGVQREITW